MRTAAFTLTLPSGVYTVKVAAKGFAESAQAVTALPGGSESREFVLALPKLGETITVESTDDYRVEDGHQRHADASRRCATCRSRSPSRRGS